MRARQVFNVFGRIMAIERSNDIWRSYWVGADGKRRPAELAIPSDMRPDELAQYLFDIYHEDATPGNGGVTELTPT